MNTKLPIIIAATALAVLPATMVVHAQQPALATVLVRAGDYIDAFERQLGGIVTEERYIQDVFPADLGAAVINPGRGGLLGSGNARQHRDLKSDLLLVRPVGADHWIQFRDVFEVDGNSVHDRNDRLAALFLKPSKSISDQVREIQDESARYNIGNLERTINVPVLTLLFLQPDVQPQFEFTRALGSLQGKPGQLVTPQDLPPKTNFTVPADAWEIQYKETASPTLIRTTGDRDLPGHGRFWIDPQTGRVLMSELVLDDPFVRGTIYVSYELDQSLGFLVPHEMREDYVIRTSGVRIQGTAKYSRFRKFQVSVDEQLVPVK